MENNVSYRFPEDNNAGNFMSEVINHMFRPMMRGAAGCIILLCVLSVTVLISSFAVLIRIPDVIALLDCIVIVFSFYMVAGAMISKKSKYRTLSAVQNVCWFFFFGGLLAERMTRMENAGYWDVMLPLSAAILLNGLSYVILLRAGEYRKALAEMHENKKDALSRIRESGPNVFLKDRKIHIYGDVYCMIELNVIPKEIINKK